MEIRDKRKCEHLRNLRSFVTGVTFELHRRSRYHFKGNCKTNNIYLKHFLQIHHSDDKKRKTNFGGHYPPPGDRVQGLTDLLPDLKLLYGVLYEQLSQVSDHHLKML